MSKFSARVLLSLVLLTVFQFCCTLAKPALAAETTFASVEEALSVFDANAGSNEADAGKKRVQAELWLTKQGAAITPKLSAALLDSKSSLSVRMACCRQLARRGPAARPALEQIIDKEKGQLRSRAIETLGRLTPPEEAAVAKLMKLMSDPELEIRRAAITGLGNQGKAAAAAAPALQKLLNDPKEDETIRGAAKVALKAVDPRKGLMDVK